MKKLLKRSLIIIAVALLAGLAGLIWLGSRPDDPVSEAVLDTSRDPAFEVHVIVPRAGLPLGGILPDSLVKKYDLTPRELKFDHTTPGAKTGRAEPNHLELSADGWELLVETDAEGRVAPGTHLVFPTGLGGKKLRLNCRPADSANGYLHTTARAGSGELDGGFLVELVTCKNAESGKMTNWPPRALTVRGAFARVPRR
jgi:hypothetical protein